MSEMDRWILIIFMFLFCFNDFYKYRLFRFVFCDAQIEIHLCRADKFTIAHRAPKDLNLNLGYHQ